MAQGRLLSAPREAELTLGLCSHTGPNSRASDGSTFGDASDLQPHGPEESLMSLECCGLATPTELP